MEACRLPLFHDHGFSCQLNRANRIDYYTSRVRAPPPAPTNSSNETFFRSWNLRGHFLCAQV